jgi:uncharacterized protein (DUF1501 family)
MNRRKFLRQSGCAAITAATMAASISKLGQINALAQGGNGYKALVCIFMSGGSDGNNMIVPFNNADGYTEYNNVRGASGLALPQSALIGPLTPASLGGRQFGFHPNLSPEIATPAQVPGLKDLWDAGKMAVVCNVGNLVQPITKAQYIAGVGRPYSLFSHSDQVAQQQSSQSTVQSQTGWAGRISDTLNGINGGALLPMVTSIAGTSLFTAGQLTRALAISDSATPLPNVLRLIMTGSAAEQTARRAAFDQLRAIDSDSYLVKGANETYAQALTAAMALSANPTIATTFPNTSIGRQLLQIARLIKLQSSLGLSRQIFYAQLGGFDTHSNQTGSSPTMPAGGGAASGNQGNLFLQLSQAMRAFYNEMEAQNMADNVTQFTLSDFGRTFQPAGSGAAVVGSDHAWGNHLMVVGGAVRGGDFYGTYPTLQLGGPTDTDIGTSPRGRWIPTTSIDQYAATLGQWFGLSAPQTSAVFPFLSRFASSNLGFMI